MFKLLSYFNPNGKKAYAGGYGLVLLGLSGVLASIGSVLTGDLSIVEGWRAFIPSWNEAVTAFMGLGIIGSRHAISKLLIELSSNKK